MANDLIRQMVELAHSAGGWPAARGVLTQLLAEQPDNPLALCAAAVIDLQLGEPATARQRLLRAVMVAPELAAPAALLGDLLAEGHEWGRALAWFRRAAAAEPTNPIHLRRLALTHLDHRQPYSALQAARQAAALSPEDAPTASLAAELERLYAPLPVAAAIYLGAPDADLEATLAGLSAQTHPVTAVMVLDDVGVGEALAGLPVEVWRGVPGLGRAAWYNEVVARRPEPWLALLAAGVVPEPDWLEQLMLPVRVCQTASEAAVLSQPAVLMGHLEDLHEGALPDRWAEEHLAEHYDGGWASGVAWVYGSNLLVNRELVAQAGGWRAELADADAELGERLRARGERVRYECRAVARRRRRIDLASAFAAPDTVQSSFYWQQRLGGRPSELSDVLEWLPSLVSRWHADAAVDSTLGHPDLAYLTFLSLPWRLSAALRRAAGAVPPAAVDLVRHSHAALLQRLAAELERLRPGSALPAVWRAEMQAIGPDDPALADPAASLAGRDGELVAYLAEPVLSVWAGLDEASWQAIERSAALWQAEQAEAARLPADAPRIALVPMGEALLATDVVDRWRATVAEAAGPVRLRTLAICASTRRVERLMAGLAGFGPDLILLRTAPGYGAAEVAELAAQVHERLGRPVPIWWQGGPAAAPAPLAGCLPAGAALPRQVLLATATRP